MSVKPGGNNYEIPNRVAFGCMGLLTLILLIEVAVIAHRILTYPQR